MRRRVIEYSAEELAFIKAHRSMTRRTLHASFVKKFNREDVSVENLKQLCLRKGWLTGRTGRYEPGSEPANKGKKMPYNENSARSQFKKGHTPHNTKYAGHERINVDGYVEVSVNETNPHTGADRRYVHKHRFLWELENGPVPDGMVLKCLDGNKTNTEPANWKLVPRGLLPRLSGIHGRKYDDAPQELKPTILAVAELAHLAQQRKKEKTTAKPEGNSE